MQTNPISFLVAFLNMVQAFVTQTTSETDHSVHDRQMIPDKAFKKHVYFRISKNIFKVSKLKGLQGD